MDRFSPIQDCHFQADPAALTPWLSPCFFVDSKCVSTPNFLEIIHPWKLTAGTRKSSQWKGNSVIVGFHLSFVGCTFKPKIQYCSTFKIIPIAKTKGGAKTSRLLCFSTNFLVDEAFNELKRKDVKRWSNHGMRLGICFYTIKKFTFEHAKGAPLVLPSSMGWWCLEVTYTHIYIYMYVYYRYRYRLLASG